MISFAVWARTEAQAAELQAAGFVPCEKSLETHHGNYSLLLRYDGPITDAVAAVLAGRGAPAQGE